MLRSIMQPMLGDLLLPMLSARRQFGGGVPSFPGKESYSQDFNGLANATMLRNMDGWAAYNSASSTSAVRDQWQVQSNALTRMNASLDYSTSPGLFVVGHDAGSTDHVFRTTLVAIPNSGGRIILVAAATAENNCVLFECTNSSGTMQNFIIRKNVAGALTPLLSQAGSTSSLGRPLQAGDEIELQVLGQRVHLFVNGYRITPAAGTDIDQGGAFTKGQICGHGTGSGVASVFNNTYIAGLAAALTVTDTSIFWPGSTVLGGRVVPLVGAYAGDVQALDYRVVHATSGAVVQDWARITGASIAAGAWSGSVFVPMCSSAVPKVRVQVRAANDVDARALSNATAVGIAVGVYGQSNAAFMGQGGATSHAVADAYTWSSDASSVWQGGATITTTRAQLMATQVAAALGVPCGVFVFGIGGASLAQLATDGAGHFDEMEAACSAANAYGYIAAWLWVQGEAEASAAGALDEHAYRSTFSPMLSQLRGAPSVGDTAPVGVCVIGRTTGGHISGDAFGDANWSAVRAGLFGLADLPAVVVSSNLVDLAMADTLHYTASSYVEAGRRAGLSLAKALGGAGYDGRGPIITGATRAAAVITLAVDLNGAASISGTGLTHYQVSTDDFATILPLASAAVSGGSIVLTLAADPGAPVKVRSFYGMTYAAPVFALGDYGTAPDIPVEPLFVPIVSD